MCRIILRQLYLIFVSCGSILLSQGAAADEICVEGAGSDEWNGTYEGPEDVTGLYRLDASHVIIDKDTFWAFAPSAGTPSYSYRSSTYDSSPVGLAYTVDVFGEEPAPSIREGNCDTPPPTPTATPTPEATPTPAPTPTAAPTPTPAGELPEKLCLKVYRYEGQTPIGGTFILQNNTSNASYISAEQRSPEFTMLYRYGDAWILAIRHQLFGLSAKRPQPMGPFKLGNVQHFEFEEGECISDNPPAGTEPPSNVTGNTLCTQQTGADCSSTTIVALGSADLNANTARIGAADFIPEVLVAVQADADGSYRFSGIDPGDYELRFLGDGLRFDPSAASITVSAGNVTTVPAPSVTEIAYAESGCKKANKRSSLLAVYDRLQVLKGNLSSAFGTAGSFAIKRLSEEAQDAFAEKLVQIKNGADNEADNLLARLFQMPVVVRSGCPAGNECATVKLSANQKAMWRAAVKIKRAGNKLITAGARKFKTKQDKKVFKRLRKQLTKSFLQTQRAIIKLPGKTQSCPVVQ